MKSLYEYLLMEVKAADFGKGWKDVSLRGKLSKEAAGILQFSSYKKATAAAANSKQWPKVIEGLEVKGTPDQSGPMEFAKSFFQLESLLSEYLVFDPKKDEADENKVQLSLKSEWRIVGGKEKLESSVKVLRFWIESTMTVYGLDTSSLGFAINKDGEKLMVYNK